MRLPGKRRIGILSAFTETLGLDFCHKSSIILMLYGSRTQQNLKGGDIDLLLLVASPFLQVIKSKKRTILAAIERKIGECRVDLMIAPVEPENQSEFVTLIIPKALKMFPRDSDSKEAQYLKG